MTTGPDRSPQPAFPEVVSQDTVEALATTLYSVCEVAPQLPGMGNILTFPATLDGERVDLVTQTMPMDHPKDRWGRVIVYPESSLGLVAAAYYLFLRRHGQPTEYVKTHPIDENRFQFDETEPDYDHPPLPFRIDGQLPEAVEMERYKARLLRAQQSSGYTDWLTRRQEAWRSFVYGQRAREDELGLNIMYEPEGQELLGELQRYAAFRRPEIKLSPQTARTAGGIAGIVRRLLRRPPQGRPDRS
jgi:hypothetical protein